MGLLLCALLAANPASTETAKADAIDLVRVEWMSDRKELRTDSGKVVVEAQDGGVLLQGRDGRLWNITPDRIRKRETLPGGFRPFSLEEAAESLRAELGPGFDIVRTRRYVIASKAGVRYAQWCGALFERLHDAFQTHWRARPLELTEPAFPLVAVILADESQFLEYAAGDVGPAAAAGAKGYYSLASNRMVLFDLTATKNELPARTLDEIQRKIARNPFNVATVVHEATHQIAFNTGMHVRQADNPLWLAEGMAMYFETPDLANRAGWRTVGKVSDIRLRRFRDFVRERRKPDSLATLLATDARFTDAETAEDAYAEAWALTHFLIRAKRKEYAEYLARVAAKPPLVWDGKEKRLEEFTEFFGELGTLEREFLRYTERLSR